jgi:hypothetical protein
MRTDPTNLCASGPTSSTTAIIGIVAETNIGYRLITAQGNAIAFGTTPTS